MAIIYQNGVATNRYDLADKIRIFLSANGWTVNGWSPVEEGGLHLQRNGNFYNIYFYAEDQFDKQLWFHLNLSTGYAAPVGGLQPGEVFPTGTTRQAVNFRVELYQEHYFFLDTATDAFYCVVEEQVGIYRHFGFGGYNIIGQAAGGGSFIWGNYVYYNVGAAISQYNSWPAASDDFWNASAGPGSVTVNRGNGREVLFNGALGPNDALFVGDNFVNSNSDSWENSGSQKVPWRYSVSDYNARIAVLPMHIWVSRPSSLYSLAGQYSSVRLVNMKNLAPEQVIDGDWMCFPLYSQSTSVDYSTGDLGLAYKRV